MRFVFFHHVGEFLRLQNLDMISPSEEVPCHLQTPTGVETNDQGAVILLFHLLTRVKLELTSISSNFR